MMGASAVAAKIVQGLFEAQAQSDAIKVLWPGLNLVAGAFDSQSGGPIAYARLEINAALRTAQRTPSFHHSREAGFSGYWFAHRIFGWKTKIVEAAVCLPAATPQGTATDDLDGAHAASRLMDISSADIARITIIDTSGPNGDRHEHKGKDLSLKGFLHSTVSSRACEWIRLGQDAASFLDRLGRHTRRNIRLAERAQSQSGMEFLFRSNPATDAQDRGISSLALRNKPRPLKAVRLAAYERLIEGKQNRFESRLCLADGRLVSYCRGYIRENVAYLIYQANDPIVPKINLSLLHRFKLIEHLIASGVTDCIFPFGCEGLLKNICETVTLEERLAVRRSFKGIATALALAIFMPGTRISRLTLQTLCEPAQKSAFGQHCGKALKGLSLLFLSPYLGIARNRQL
jgi:hypothetical protein